MRAQADSQPPPAAFANSEVPEPAATEIRHHLAGIELTLFAYLGYLVRGGFVYDLVSPSSIEIGPDGDVISATYLEWSKRSATELECRLWRAACAAYQGNLGTHWDAFVSQVQQFTVLVDSLLGVIRQPAAPTAPDTRENRL